MSTEPTFAEWLKGWLRDNPEWTQQRLAEAIPVSEAAMSDWVNGKNPPRDLNHITRLAEITERDAHWLANRAYGWALPPPTDPMLKSPIVREGDQLLSQLERLAPDQMPLVIELIRSVLRLVRRREKG